MTEHFIKTNFFIPSQSVPGPDGTFTVSDPFAADLAKQRLQNVLRGISEYIRTPFYMPSQSVAQGGVYVVQDPMAAFNAAGPLSGLGDSTDPTVELPPGLIIPDYPQPFYMPALMTVPGGPSTLDPKALDNLPMLPASAGEQKMYNLLTPHPTVRQPTIMDWLNQPLGAGIPLSRGMAIGGAAALVFVVGLVKPKRGRR